MQSHSTFGETAASSLLTADYHFVSAGHSTPMISSGLLALFEISHLVFVFGDVAKYLDACRGKMALGRGSVEYIRGRNTKP